MPIGRASAQATGWVRRSGLLSGTALVVALLFVGAWLSIKPAPPRTLVFAAGAEGGAYHAFARRYATLLARDGLTVEVRTTEGSVDNLAQLRAAEGGADVAFVQGGIATDEEREGLQSLGALFPEPLWVFTRGDRPLDGIAALRGRRIVVGPDGSGGRRLVSYVLTTSGVGPENSTWLDLGTRSGADALKAGEADALLLVSAPGAIVRELVRTPGVQLMSLARAEAYYRLVPAVSRLTIPRGVLDLSADLPARDVETIAATATLVARDDLHPALAYLLVKAAREIHGAPSVLAPAREFPTIARFQEFEVGDYTERLYTVGSPFLYKHLPFWAANLIERMWVLLIPLAAVLVSVSNLVPKLLAFEGNRRVNAIYKAARRLESDLLAAPDDADWPAYFERMQALYARADAVRLPAAFLRALYDLRAHLDMVNARLVSRARRPDPPPAPPPA